MKLASRVIELYPQIDVLVVDDSSPDGTASEVEEAQKLHGNRLLLNVRTGEKGRGVAVLEGLSYAVSQGYSLAFEMDADWSHQPEEIDLFLKKIEECDIVVGSRYLPESTIRYWGWKRTIFSWLANHFLRCVLGIPITDYTNGFRCYSRDSIQSLDMEHIDAKGYIVLSEIAYQLHRKGKHICEVPTVFINRRRGDSNMGFHLIREAFGSALCLRFPKLKRFIGNKK